MNILTLVVVTPSLYIFSSTPIISVITVRGFLRQTSEVVRLVIMNVIVRANVNIARMRSCVTTSPRSLY